MLFPDSALGGKKPRTKMFKARPSAASPYAPFEEEKKEEGEHAIDADEMDKLFAAMN